MLPDNRSMNDLLKLIEIIFFKKPIDEFDDLSSTPKILKSYFFKCEWYEVSNFIEFIAINLLIAQ